MTDEKSMKQLALRLAAHLKKRNHPVPFEVLTHVLAAMRGFTNWHVFLRRKVGSDALSLKLTDNLTYFTDVLRAARDALYNAPPVWEAHLQTHNDTQVAAALLVEDAIAALKAQEANLPVQSAETAAALWDSRQQEADRVYERYNFADGRVVDDQDGWANSPCENELTRKVYVRTDEGDDVGSSVKLTFHVRFAPGFIRITDIFARDDQGSDWGMPGISSAHAYYVYVATYDYKHGDAVRVFKTEEAALAWRTAIAQDYWDDTFADADCDEPKPDEATIGERYFELMREGDGYVESFDITYAPLEV
jgi:hypothetical protein